mmetsp:Transcript_175699/g.558038  ORF Transcript_175699/g.558038 Transcript_175699/m.558038 type:complete len:272 (-) Transcript_175699:3752-4567(-)
MDTSRLVMMLSSLAATCSDSETEPLHRHYQSVAQKLKQGIERFHRDACKCVEESQAYEMAIDVYVYLKQQYDLGLRDHLRDLSFDIGKALEEFRDKDHKADTEHRACLLDPSQIDRRWKPDMDRFVDQYCTFNPLTWDTAGIYKAKRNKLCQHVLAMIEFCDKSLQQRNYDLVQQYITALRHIQLSLHKHIDAALSHRSDNLLEAVKRECASLCDVLVLAFTQDNFSFFTFNFKQFRSLVFWLSGSVQASQSMMFACVEPFVRTVATESTL